ncbi:MAG: type I-C CRISPR-associated protein Cas5c [Syntrophobacteraceae bacterium]|nr:type I-C CRISPR-associated protein Cas5c [Syntrophobacteraceae bacterium]
MSNKNHILEVWGEFACFTRPEMKVERFSYPVITPSAARGIFDAIYWEGIREPQGMRPYFHWQVEKIEVLEMPRYIALRRNEVKDRVPSERTIKAWIEGREQPEPLWADGGKDELGTDQKGRTQRQTMALKNVRYRLTARILPKQKFVAPEHVNKFNDIFERRAKQGKCFQQPFFGCSEFPAFFQYVQPAEQSQKTFQLDQHIGWMLYDVFDLRREVVRDDTPFISLFDATVKKGVLEVPPFESPQVRKPERGRPRC